MKKQTTRGNLNLIVMGAVLLTGWTTISAANRTYIVNKQAPNASDDNPGTKALPLKTIQAGANLAQPGDTVLVRSGIYREEVAPPRGGVSHAEPITYRAALGEVVSIRGSEQITTWQQKNDGVWMVELDTAFFKGYNPFAIPVDGKWFTRRNKNRLGDVYCKGEALFQKTTFKEMQSTYNTWYTDLNYGYINKFDFPADRQYPNDKIQIWANFGDVNPNSAFTEINARATAFFPEKAGLKYIVVDGFDIRHTAPQWADIYTTEMGAIGTRYGYGWIIQNCTISDSRNIGISLGVTDEVHFPYEDGLLESKAHIDKTGLSEGGSNIPDYDSSGHHLIRRNVITRCGQAGIYGCYGAVGSVIEENVVTETNYRNEWNGMNQAAIKILFPIDVIIRNNLLIGIPGLQNTTKGIWLDWGSQNTRVTGNIICDFNANKGMFLEVNFGPIIVDNNIFVRADILVMSNGSVFAHNLIHNCRFMLAPERRRYTPYYKPHSTVRTGTAKASLLHTRIYNNIMSGDKENDIRKNSNGSDIDVNYNIFLNGAKPFPGKDAMSTVIDSKAEIQLQLKDREALLKFTLPPAALEGRHPLITAQWIGKVPLAQMVMEHPDGKPHDITSDYFGKAIKPDRILPGPFQLITNGENNIVLWPRPIN